MDELKALKLLIISLSTKIKKQDKPDAAATSALSRLVDSYRELKSSSNGDTDAPAPLRKSLKPRSEYT